MAVEPIEISEIQGISDFLQKIDWSDGWFLALISFHLMASSFLVLTVVKKWYNAQVGIFLTSLLLVYCAEYINEWAAHNYRLFSREQYFDDKGLFISIVFSAPILINNLCLIVVWLHQVYSLLREVHLKKYKQKKDS